MLVYLDTGDLSHLETATTSAPAVVADFLSRWTARGYTLAVSLHHVQEIAILADHASQARRLSLLQRFPSIAFANVGAEQVIRQEVSEQLRASIEHRPTDYSPIATVFQPSSAAEIAAAVFGATDAFRLMRVPQTMAAEAENIGRNSKPAAFKKMTADKVDLSTIPDMVDIAIRDHGLDPQLRGWAIEMATRMGELAKANGDMRSGLEKYYGVAGFTHLELVSDRDLARFATVVSFAQEEGPPQLIPHLKDLNPYLCPALRLVFALERAQAASEEEASPSSKVDAEHLHFAPYVGRMTVDKRTYNYLLQETRRDKRLLPPSALDPLRKSTGVTALMNALD